MTDTLTLLTLPYEGLSLPDRASALLYAREAGKTAADMAISLSDLETPSPMLYQRHVVEYARDAGRLSAEAAAAWQRDLLGMAGLRDPRVQAFFFGWHERAVERMTELAGETGDEPDLKARWFLGGLKP